MASHARGVAYAVKAVGLANPHNATAAADEARWQLSHASLAVREVLRRLPAAPAGGGALGALINEIHADVTRNA